MIIFFFFQLEEDKYHPLEPSRIRLPPPAPPSERLLAAVDAFYAAPNHERPRDKYVQMQECAYTHNTF